LGAQARSAFASGTMAEEKKEEGGFFANLFNFGGGAPASAPEPESTPDVSDAPAKAESAASSAEAEKAKWLLSLEPAQIDGYEPSQVVEVLSAAVQTTPDINPSLIEACCKRLRVLCREPENCKRCDEAGTASAVVAAMGMLPTLQSVQLQALAAIVNLCSGEANEHRKNAVDSGAMTAIVAAMLALADNAEVQEMACIALQNCCYGEDDHSLTRRTTAATEGAIEAVVKAMQKHVDSPPMQEVGQATLRLIVHKLPDLRTKALSVGAQEEWVKPISQGGGGMFSFRRSFGFGTSRRNKPKTPAP